MAYYDIYIGDKPYQLYIEDKPCNANMSGLPNEVYGKLSVTYDDANSNFIVKVDDLNSRGRYAMEHNRLYIVPEIMTGTSFSTTRDNRLPRKVRSTIRNRAGKYWGLVYTRLNTNDWQNNSIIEGRKISNIGEKFNFPRSSIIPITENEVLCHCIAANSGVNQAWGYRNAQNAWVKTRFYLICFDKEPQPFSFSDGFSSLPYFRFKKTDTPIIQLVRK